MLYSAGFSGLVVLIMTSLLYLQTSTYLPPLQNMHTITFQGTVKPAQALKLTNPTTGALMTVSTPTLCEFEIMLKLGQNHVEARMVGLVRKTSTGCVAHFDVGIPTVIQPPPQTFGAPAINATAAMAPSITTAVGDLLTPGHNSGNAPDLTPIFGETAQAPNVGSPITQATAQPQLSSGYISAIVYDPINIQVTYENLVAVQFQLAKRTGRVDFGSLASQTPNDLFDRPCENCRA